MGFKNDVIDNIFYNAYENINNNQKPLIGVKGRIQSRIVESPEGTRRRKTEIVAERVTFLTSNPNRKRDQIDSDEEPDESEEADN